MGQKLRIVTIPDIDDGSEQIMGFTDETDIYDEPYMRGRWDMSDRMDIYDDSYMPGDWVFDLIKGIRVEIRARFDNGTYQVIDHEAGTVHLREYWEISDRP